MDHLLAEITAEAEAETTTVLPWSAGDVLTLAARHRLSDEEPDSDDDDDDDDDDWDDDEDLDDEDWDDEDLDDDDWDDDDDDDDWDDDDDEEDEATNRASFRVPVAAWS